MDATMPKQTPARVLLILAAALNLIPLAYTGLLIAPGTVAGGPDYDRMFFIASHQALWSAGWVLWMGGSLGLVLSIWVVSRAVAHRTHAAEILRFAPIVALLGAAVDIVGDGIQAAGIPVVAARFIPGPIPNTYTDMAGFLFSVLDNIASLLSGDVANTLYFVAGTLVVIALATIADFPKWLTALGAVAWLATLAATPATFFPAILPVAVASALALYVIWLLAVAIWGLGGGMPRIPLPHFHRV
jgi:hypothetical protein